MAEENCEAMASCVFLPGSQQRADRMTELWTNVRSSGRIGDYEGYVGSVGDTAVGVWPTGIGGSAVCRTVDHVRRAGARTLIRVGVTGTIQSGVKAGDLMIATAAVRWDNVSTHYLPIAAPAVADPHVVMALVTAAEELDAPYHVGVGATQSSFYVGGGVTSHAGYRHSGMDNLESDMRAAGVLDWDTETAPLFILGLLHNLRCGRVNAVVNDPETGEYDPFGEDRMIAVAMRAAQILDLWDSQAENHLEETTP